MVLHSIKGLLTEKQPAGCACCEVNGIEWSLAMSKQGLAQLPPVGSQVRIYTLLRVSENSIALYGFAAKTERSLFEALISVSGVGPKLALGLLSQAQGQDIATWISNEDAASLAKLPGLGHKTAQKLILQLSDKLPPDCLRLPDQGRAAGPPVQQGGPQYDDLHSALLAMGYDAKHSQQVLERLFTRWQDKLPPEGERLRQAIVQLGS